METNSSVTVTKVEPTQPDPLNKVTYKATKLWLDTLNLFRNGVKLGKHRAILRQYDKCFVAHEVITWFHSELQKKFEIGITRKQTLNLLQKFYKAGIFTEVTNQQSANEIKSSVIKETDFKDNRRLFRFVEEETDDTSESENNDKSIPTKDTRDKDYRPASEYYVVIKPLSMEQIYKIWEQTFIQRFCEVVGYDVFTSFLQPGTINGSWILHNMTKLSVNGIVLINPIDELPSWIMNAMRSLTRWQTNNLQNENVLPTYAGFEVDVFNVVRDYFSTFKDVAPLVTFDLYDAFITTFIRSLYFDINNRQRFYQTKKWNKSSKNMRIINQRKFVQEEYPFAASDSVEDLLINIFTPSPQKKSGTHFKKRAKAMHPRRILGIRQEANHQAVDESVVVDDMKIEPMPSQSYDIKKYTQRHSVTSIDAQEEEPVFLETAFTSDHSPITRIISTAEIESSLGAICKPSTLKISTDENDVTLTPTLSLSHKFAYENPLLQLSPADLINHPKYSKLLKATQLASDANVPSNASFEAALKVEAKNDPETPEESEITRSLDPGLLGAGAANKVPLLVPELMTTSTTYRRSQSATNLSDSNRDRCPYAPPLRKSQTQGGMRASIHAQYVTSPSKSARKTMEILSGFTANAPTLMTSEGKAYAITSFRLLTLLLPPKNRRYLQILLQFMAKTAQNEKLMIDVGNTNRAIVINEFFSSIIGCSIKKEYDEFLGQQIVTFLMDNIGEIFDVGKEEKLKKEAEAFISEQQIEKVPMNVSSSKKENKENRFSCSRVTLDVYDDQRLFGATAQSLRCLLSAWDALENPKERKKHLKKFRKEYPHIYSERFGDSDDAGGLESSTEKEKEKHRGILRSIF